MIKLRAFPVLLAIAALMAAQSTVAQTTATVGGGAFNPSAGPSSSGNGTGGPADNACDGSGHCSGPRLADTSFAQSGDQLPAPSGIEFARRADAAWAKGDRKNACEWIQAAQRRANSYVEDYASRVDQYCAADTGSSTDRS